MKAILDLETGGFSITKNGICEIGILIINDALEVVHERSFLIKPYTRPNSEELVSYKKDAMAVNGITIEEIEGGEKVGKVCWLINEIFKAYKVDALIGHNIRKFDFPRIKYLFDRFALCDFEYEIIDTLELCRENLNLNCNKLESICDHFKIVNNSLHRALGDCYATLEVYKRLNEVENLI